MFLKPSFFEMIQKIVANVICISQGVIIFCAPNKMDTEKKKRCDVDTSCFVSCPALNCKLSWHSFSHTLDYQTVYWTLRFYHSAPQLKVVLNLFLTAPITCVPVQLVTLFCIHS